MSIENAVRDISPIVESYADPGEDTLTAVVDMITDLLYYAESHGLDAEAVIEKSVSYFQARI